MATTGSRRCSTKSWWWFSPRRCRKPPHGSTSWRASSRSSSGAAVTRSRRSSGRHRRASSGGQARRMTKTRWRSVGRRLRRRRRRRSREGSGPSSRGRCRRRARRSGKRRGSGSGPSSRGENRRAQARKRTWNGCGRTMLRRARTRRSDPTSPGRQTIWALRETETRFFITPTEKNAHHIILFRGQRESLIEVLRRGAIALYGRRGRIDQPFHLSKRARGRLPGEASGGVFGADSAVHFRVRVPVGVRDGVPARDAAAARDGRMPRRFAELTHASVELHLDTAVDLDARELGPHLALALVRHLEHVLWGWVDDDAEEVVQAVRHHHCAIALPRLRKELEEPKHVEEREELDDLLAAVLPLRLDKVGEDGARPPERAEVALRAQQRRDVRVGL
mmetsp:Transcript_18413/g.59902  ORF Transcript_18413/g.59902 Transcript_18413/m.59902 type:complete len:392 (-) Transcript_18413:1204-2379(-)